MRKPAVSYAGPLFLLVISLLSTSAVHALPAPAQAAPADAMHSFHEQHWWVCRYLDPKDPAKPALGSIMYYALIPSSGDVSLNRHFNGYVQQNYKVTNNGNSGTGYCQRVSDDAATRANSMDMMQKQWASSNIEAIHVKWTDTPEEDAVIDVKLAAPKASPAAAPPSGAGSKECAFHGNCPPAPATVHKPRGHLQ